MNGDSLATCAVTAIAQHSLSLHYISMQHSHCCKFGFVAQGGAATQQERAQVFDDSTTQQPDTSREEGQAGLRTDATDVSALNSLGSLAGAAAEIGLSDSTGAVHTGQDAINMQV